MTMCLPGFAVLGRWGILGWWALAPWTARLGRDRLRVWGRILGPFVLSRSVVLFGAICLPPLLGPPDNKILPFPPPTEWPRLSLSVLHFADSLWYLGIVQDGYQPGPFSAAQSANWAFFPLYPLLVKGLSLLLPLDPVWAGILLSNLAFLGALAALHDLVECEAGPSVARRAVWLLTFFPVSYFFSGFRPESVFLLLTVLSYREARQARWWSAGLFGALAAATRLQGVLLAILVGAEALGRYGCCPRALARPAGAIVLMGIPIVGFMVYLRWLTGDPLAFTHIQAAWGKRLVLPGYGYVRFLVRPLLIEEWDLGPVNFLLTSAGLMAGVLLLTRGRFGQALYTAAHLAIPLSSGFNLLSMGRFVSVVFPMYPAVAAWLERRPPAWWDATLAICAGLLAVMSFLAATGNHAAMT